MDKATEIYDQKRIEAGITAMLEAAQAKGLNLLELKQAAQSIATVTDKKLQENLKSDDAQEILP